MAHQLMLHGHPVGYLPPTYASEILTSDGHSVEEKVDWFLVGTDTNTNPIALPNDISELSIIIHQTGDYGVTFQFHILKEELSSSNRTFRNGYYLNSSNNGATAINVSSSQVTPVSYYIGGSSYLANSTTEVYAKK